MPQNDPTDTGGLFLGRRPGTAPVRYRGTPSGGSPRRKRIDEWLAHGLLALETLLCVSLWGPQPVAWLWVGSQVDYRTGSVSFGILSAFLGMGFTLLVTLILAKKLDHAWQLVRRAAGHDQRNGALERIFVVSAGIVGTLFVFWFFVIEGPGPQLAPAD